MEPLKKMPNSSIEGLQRTCNNRFAFLAHADVMDGIEKIPCNILRIPTPAFTTYAGMHLAPDSEFQRVFAIK